jgi:hypothetical protein
MERKGRKAKKGKERHKDIKSRRAWNKKNLLKNSQRKWKDVKKQADWEEGRRKIAGRRWKWRQWRSYKEEECVMFSGKIKKGEMITKNDNIKW